MENEQDRRIPGKHKVFTIGIIFPTITSMFYLLFSFAILPIIFKD